MLRYALIALIAVVSAEDAITVTQSNPASGYVSCNAAGLVADNADNTGAHLVTITHGRCKLELTPTHTNGEDASAGHMYHIAGAVADPSDSASDYTASHNGHFETKYDDNFVTHTDGCDMDIHTKVDFEPVIDTPSNNFQVKVILSKMGENSNSWTSGQYQSGYKFKQYYDDVLLTGTGTNYEANSDSGIINVIMSGSSSGPGVHDTTTFTWASGCDDALPCTASNNFATDITCTHLVDSITNPKGLIKATHSTVQGHTKHKCWVDHAEPNALTNAAACKCQCVP
jgi:hypothetical protein